MFPALKNNTQRWPSSDSQFFNLFKVTVVLLNRLYKH